MSVILKKDGNNIKAYVKKNDTIKREQVSIPAHCQGCNDLVVFGGGSLCLMSLDKPASKIDECPIWDIWEDEIEVSNN